MTIPYDSQLLKKLCLENSISYLGLFGSCAEGKPRPDSDIDLLVKFHQTRSFFEKGGLILKLQDLFGREVDLVSFKHLKPSVKPYVMKQLVTLYER